MPVRTIPIIGGIVALVLAFGFLHWAWLALYTSLFGLILAAVIAHGVGTAVAMALDVSSATRTFQQVIRRVGLAALCALILYIAIPVTYKALIYLSPELYRMYSGWEAILSSVIIYALCAAVTRRFEPAWYRYAGLLALVALIVTSTYVSRRSVYSASPTQALPAPGGPNTSGAPPPLAP
jgi:hypothetical protein